MKNIRVFYLKNFGFLEVKFSIYLNRRVFAMMTQTGSKFSTSTVRIEGFQIYYKI